MEKLTFELEFITPAFIGGANQEAELRPASFIGLLRWWWRVVLASFIEDTETIYKWEGELFGTQDRAGAVFLRLKNMDDIKINKGLNTYMLGMGGRRRHYIEPGTKFKLELIVPDVYKKVVNELAKLALNFGGIGYRGRKGFGSMKLHNANVDAGSLSASYWKNLLKEIGLEEGKPNNDIPNLRNLILLRYENRNLKDWKQLIGELERIYRSIRKYKNGKTPEYYSCIYYFLRKRSINKDRVIFANLPFGLPIMFQSKEKYTTYPPPEDKKREHAKAQLNWKLVKNDKTDTDKRRASSILFNVKENGFYALAFKCKFLPEDAELVVKAKGKYWDLKGERKPNPVSFPFNNDEYLDIFEEAIERLKKAGFKEVSL